MLRLSWGCYECHEDIITVMGLLWLVWGCYHCHNYVMNVMRMLWLSRGCHDCYGDVKTGHWYEDVITVITICCRILWLTWWCYDCHEDVMTRNELSSAGSDPPRRPTSCLGEQGLRRRLLPGDWRRKMAEVASLRNLEKERFKRLNVLPPPPRYPCSPNPPCPADHRGLPVCRLCWRRQGRLSGGACVQRSYVNYKIVFIKLFLTSFTLEITRLACSPGGQWGAPHALWRECRQLASYWHCQLWQQVRMAVWECGCQ